MMNRLRLFFLIALALIGQSAFAIGPSTVAGKPYGGGFELDFIGAPQFQFNNLITFTRASTATYFDKTGTMVIAAADTPRFDYDPVTLKPKGFLIEGARTNLFLDSAALSTQGVAVTAQAYTVSFYGTGSITFSGAYTGTLNGAGAGTPASVTFTPTAGTVTCTVSGSVTYANFEAGTFRSSWIPTSGSSATRAADVATITDLSRIGFNPLQGSLLIEYMPIGVDSPTGQQLVNINDGGATNSLRIFKSIGSNATQGAVGTTSSLGSPGVVANTMYKSALGYNATGPDNTYIHNGTAYNGSIGTAIIPTSFTQMNIGNRAAQDAPAFIYLRRLVYFPYRLPDATLQNMSAL